MPTVNPTDLADGDVLSELWVDATAQHVVRVYSSTGARDADLTDPHVGQTVVISSNTADEGVWVYTSNGTWRRPWNMPWGVGHGGTASNVTQQTGIGTSAADLTALSVSWTAVANRRLLVSGKILVEKSSSAGAFTLSLTNAGGTLVEQLGYKKLATSDLQSFAFSTIITSPGGSATLKLRGLVDTGTAVIRNDALTGQLSVTDVGPAGMPA